jgi:hypothetical protein
VRPYPVSGDLTTQPAHLQVIGDTAPNDVLYYAHNLDDVYDAHQRILREMAEAMTGPGAGSINNGVVENNADTHKRGVDAESTAATTATRQRVTPASMPASRLAWRTLNERSST